MQLTDKSVGVIVERARLASGLSKSALAASANTSRSALDEIEKGTRMPRVDTFLRLLEVADHNVDVPLSLSSSPKVGMTLTRFVSKLDCSDPDWVWRTLVSDFVANEFVPATRGERYAMLLPKPDSVGSTEWDVFICALAEHLAFHADIDAPTWVTESVKTIDHFWWPVHGKLPSMRSAAFSNSPASFKRRMILIDGTELPEVFR